MISFKRITSSTNDVLDIGATVLGARLVSAAADAQATLHDEEGGTSDASEFCELNVTEDETNGTGQAHPGADKQDFHQGIKLRQSLSVTLSGTGAVLYVYYG